MRKKTPKFGVEKVELLQTKYIGHFFPHCGIIWRTSKVLIDRPVKPTIIPTHQGRRDTASLKTRSNILMYGYALHTALVLYPKKKISIEEIDNHATSHIC